MDNYFWSTDFVLCCLFDVFILHPSLSHTNLVSEVWAILVVTFVQRVTIVW